MGVFQIKVGDVVLKKVNKMKNLILFLSVLFSFITKADIIAYNERFMCSEGNDQFLIIHQHDWGFVNSDWELRKLIKEKGHFGHWNNYSFINKIDIATGDTLYSKPCPPMRELYLDSLSGAVLGVSTIKLDNQSVFVVFDAEGFLLYEGRRVDLFNHQVKLSESVTNFLIWYNQDHPDFKFGLNGDSIRLSFNDFTGAKKEIIVRSNLREIEEVKIEKSHRKNRDKQKTKGRFKIKYWLISLGLFGIILVWYLRKGKARSGSS